MLLVFAFADCGFGQEASEPVVNVSFPTQDGGEIFGLLYGKGDRAVVLAHGARFNKESWEPQAKAIAKEGFRVLAIDFSGYGRSHGPANADRNQPALHLDILAAVKYLRSHDARSVAVIGASMGGGAAGEAVVAAAEGDIDRCILLAAVPTRNPEKLRGRKLFIVARNDGNGARLESTREQYNKAPDPKELIILDGDAHAQNLFQTNQAERLLKAMIDFLKAS